MKNENGFWIDENGNKWSAENHTEAQAREKSKTLVHCVGCVDCWDCVGCVDCWDCVRCKRCVGCADKKEEAVK